VIPKKANESAAVFIAPQINHHISNIPKNKRIKSVKHPWIVLISRQKSPQMHQELAKTSGLGDYSETSRNE
jgi:hypothetical protein